MTAEPTSSSAPYNSVRRADDWRGPSSPKSMTMRYAGRRASGKGSVVIDYSSLDELSGIVKRIKRH